MKFHLISTTAGFVLVFLSVTDAYTTQEDWENYKKNHKKTYSGIEDNLRKEIFDKTNTLIDLKNNLNPDYTLGHTAFSDLTVAERNSSKGLRIPPLSSRDLSELSGYDFPLERLSKAIPKSYDLRSNKCLPAIKDQGQCGSCWAFAATVPLEFAICTKYKNTTLLSEQQLVDCDVGGNDAGCNGGFYTSAWNYLVKARGQAKQQVYPYTSGAKGVKGACKFTTATIGARVANYSYIPNNNPVAMQSAILTYGPIAVSLYASAKDFSYYTGGIYTSAQCNDHINQQDHAVTIVGWGTSNGVDYWIARNQWGTSWGMKGYFYIQRGVNKCGIESGYSAYVVPV